MANKFRGEVSIRLDQTRILRFTLQSRVAFKERFGKPIQEVLAAAQRGQFDTGDLRNLLWAALLHENPSLTPEQVGPLLDTAEGDCCDDQEIYIGKKIMQAWAHTQPAPLKKTTLKSIEHFEASMAKALAILEEKGDDLLKRTMKETSGGPTSSGSASATSGSTPGSSGT